MTTIERLINGYDLIKKICSNLARSLPVTYTGETKNLIESNLYFKRIYEIFNYTYINDINTFDQLVKLFLGEIINMTPILVMRNIMIYGTGKLDIIHDITILFQENMNNMIIGDLIKKVDENCIYNRLSKLYWENPANFKQLFSEVNI